METPSSASAATSPPPEVRRYKACRICRRQKLRCDGATPCRRCRVSGATCVYDQSASRRRHPAPNAGGTGSASQAQQIESLSAQVQRLQALVAQSQSQSQSQSPTSSPGPTSSSQAVVVHGSLPERTFPKPRDREVLSPDDLEVPATAVHITMHPSPMGQPQRNFQGWTPWNQSQWHREEYRITSVIERALVDEAQARRLFGNFMQHCNIATPIFDPVLDTFESVNELYPFTMTVVLYLAARQDASNEFDSALKRVLEVEVKRLAANTLFENPCSLDSVQAMLLLAVHSEKTWFALGHAYQMALDLRLDHLLTQAVELPDNCSRYDFHCARLWLFVVYFERAIAISGGRWSRCNAIEPHILERYVQQKYSHPSDIFFCGSLELFDMSASLRLSADLPPLGGLQNQLNAWFAKWNTHYDKQCIHAGSLQRIHLTVQMLYAKNWQLAIILARQLRSGLRDDDMPSLIDQILRTEYELFEYVAKCDAYMRYLPWAPTCEVLLLTFTVILGCKIVSMNHDPAVHTKFRELSAPIAQLLRKHPCQRYSRVADDLLRSMVPPPGPGEQGAGGNGGEAAEWQENDWNLETHFEELFGDWTGEWVSQT